MKLFLEVSDGTVLYATVTTRNENALDSIVCSGVSEWLESAIAEASQQDPTGSGRPIELKIMMRRFG